MEFNAETQRRDGAERIENLLSEKILDAAIEVHRTLGGPGLLESLYEDALYHELTLRSIPVQAQVQVPVIYKNSPLRDAMRLDLVVDCKVIIEVKAVEKESSVHRAQILTYLRLTGLKLGLLINFGQARLIDGFHRIANGL